MEWRKNLVGKTICSRGLTLPWLCCSRAPPFPISHPPHTPRPPSIPCVRPKAPNPLQSHPPLILRTSPISCVPYRTLPPPHVASDPPHAASRSWCCLHLPLPGPSAPPKPYPDPPRTRRRRSPPLCPWADHR
jgi:hypothetical protein